MKVTCLRLVRPFALWWIRYQTHRYIHKWVWGDFRQIDVPEFSATMRQWNHQEIWWRCLR